MLNKAIKVLELVIINSRGHQFFHGSAGRLSTTAKQEREEIGKRHLNHSRHSPWHMPLSDPQRINRNKTSILCKGKRGTLSCRLVHLKMGKLTETAMVFSCLWLAEHYHNPKPKGLFKKIAFFQMTSKKAFIKKQTGSQMENITTKNLR